MKFNQISDQKAKGTFRSMCSVLVYGEIDFATNGS
jgi:hypothetical protein